MKNKIYLWLSFIEGLNYYIFIRLIKVFESTEKLYRCSNDYKLFRRILKDNNINLEEKTLYMLTNKKVKERANALYEKYIACDIKIISLNSAFYPNELLQTYDVPLVVFAVGDLNILKNNDKKVYVYYNNYFDGYGKKIYTKLVKDIQKNLGYNMIICNDTESIKKNYSNEKRNIFIIKNIDEIKNTNFSRDFLDSNAILFTKNSNSRYEYISLLVALSNTCIIPQARYEEEILNISNSFIELGKDIFSVPGYIYNKNNYFSNYLIKEGANVFLSIKEIFSSKMYSKSFTNTKN